jgi:Flp pilus assembly protein TadD
MVSPGQLCYSNSNTIDENVDQPMRRPNLLKYCLLLLACDAASPAWSSPPSALPPGIDSSGVAVLPDGRSPRSRALYLALISDMRRSGKTYAALAHLDAFDKLYPRATDAAVLRGDCLVDIGSYADAQAIYRKLLKTRGTAASAYAGLGRIDGLNGHWVDAAGNFNLAVNEDPTNPNYLNDYGYALLRQGTPDQALFRIRQASELAPGDVRVRNNLILVLAATGDKAGSRALLDSIPDQAERAEMQAAITAQSPKPALPVVVAPIVTPIVSPPTTPTVSAPQKHRRAHSRRHSHRH